MIKLLKKHRTTLRCSTIVLKLCFLMKAKYTTSLAPWASKRTTTWLPSTVQCEHCHAVSQAPTRRHVICWSTCFKIYAWKIYKRVNSKQARCMILPLLMPKNHLANLLITKLIQSTKEPFSNLFCVSCAYRTYYTLRLVWMSSKLFQSGRIPSSKST